MGIDSTDGRSIVILFSICRCGVAGDEPEADEMYALGDSTLSLIEL